jgi:1-hydroxycarotenoid 3,4-desaturase
VQKKTVAIIGSGIGGLVAALGLAARGFAVTVLERAEQPGGKLREVEINGRRMDAGPTVLTLRRVFETIFHDAEASLERELSLRPLDVLARHAWGSNERLDLYADIDRSTDAISALAGSGEGRAFRRFCAQAERTFRTLEQPFISRPQPSLAALIAAAGVRGMPDLWRINPYVSLWRALAQEFGDPRLRQLFGRYATYCGSSPFVAPATLMLVAHVEREGVWLVEGGMHRIALVLARLATERGARFRYGTEVAEIRMSGGRASELLLAGGERVSADAVIVNADSGALAAGMLGPEVAAAGSVVLPSQRSFSAMAWSMLAETSDFPLIRHNVFFSGDYPAEFDALRRGRLPAAPSVYVCAHDRGDPDDPAPDGPERLLCIVNAPASGDIRPLEAAEIQQCEESTFGLLKRCGLTVSRRPEATLLTSPVDFHRLYPGTGGALYGRASHGWTASFRRPGVRSRIPGLYLAGGSVHPGAGVPMAALSGRMAAACVIADLASTARSRGMAMPGGMSTR